MEVSNDSLPAGKEHDLTGLQHDLEKLQESHDVLLHQLEERNGMLSKLHLQLDRCLDENEELKEKLTEKEGDLAAAGQLIKTKDNRIQELEECEVKLNKMKALAVKLKKELAEAKNELNNEKSGDRDLKEILKQANKDKEKIAALYQQSVKNFQNLQSEYDLLQDECEKTKKELKVRETDLNNAVEALNKVREELAESKLEATNLKTQLTNARSSEDEKLREREELSSKIVVLQAQLEQEKRKVTNQIGLEQRLIEMRNQIDLKTTENVELSEQLERLLSKENEAVQLEEQLETLGKVKVQLVEKTKELQSTYSELLQKFEAVNAQYEEEKLLKTEYIEENSNLKQKLVTSEENLSKKIRSLESTVLDLREQYALAEEELKRKEAEFSSYKLRVCKVLNEKNGSALEGKVKELEQCVESLKADLAAAEQSAVALQNENAAKENLMVSLKEEIKQMKFDLDQLVILKRENETLKQLSRDLQYKIVAERNQHEKSVVELNEQYSKEISTLRDAIVSLEERLTAKEENRRRLDSHSSSSTAIGEAREGSTEATDLESVETTSLPSKTKRLSGASSLEPSVHPLQEILNPEKKDDFEEAGPQVDVEQMHSLRSLLEECESNNLLLTEQNRVLKDEIRRLERSMERLELADNLEYLKNVLIKFITLEDGSSEKHQLVPVLKTVLKLTPEEVGVLESVNGVQQIQVKEPAPNWSTYLWNGFN